MDWVQIIKDIVSTGVRQEQIATYCGCGQSTISDLLVKKGRDPSYSLGAKLLLLHKRCQRHVSLAVKKPSLRPPRHLRN